MESEGLSWWQTPATNLSYIIGAFESEKLPRCCQATGRLPRMPVLPCPDSDGRGAPSGVAGGDPPRGASIRRPPKVCQQRAAFISNWLCRITAGQSRHSFAHFDLNCFSPILSFPQEAPVHRSPAPRLRLLRLLAHLVRFFRFPNRN